MYPSILSEIREAIKRRYELIPYLYELSFRSAQEAQPLQRWTGWGPYDKDPNVWNDQGLRAGETQYFLGDAFLVGGVYEENSEETKVYLPCCINDQTEDVNQWESYYDHGFIYVHFPYQYYSPGQWVTVPTPLSNIAVFARVGSVVPVGLPCVTTASPPLEPNLKHDDWRGVEIYPGPRAIIPERPYIGMWREDDGISNDGGVNVFRLFYMPKKDMIEVQVECIAKELEVLWGEKIWIILPFGEERPVISVRECNGAKIQVAPILNARDARGRSTYQVEVPTV